MNDERYKKIIAGLGIPESQSLLLALEQVANEVAQEHLQKRIAMEVSLRRIANWELPSTDEFVDEDKTIPATYGCLYGSNGERDYMRHIAQAALAT